RREDSGRRGAVVRFWASFGLSGLCLAVRRRLDATVTSVPAVAAALRARPPILADEAARQGQRHSLRHRTRDRRTDCLPRHGMDQGDRPCAFRVWLIAPDKPGVKLI